MYRDYVFSKHIELENHEDLENCQKTMACSFYQLDQELASLLKEMEVQDTSPSQPWADNLRSQFDWIQGVARADAKNGVVALSSNTRWSLDEVEEEALREYPWCREAMQWFATSDGTSATLFLIRPYYQEMSWQGNILVSVDMEMLAQCSAEPQEIIILQSDLVLWPGNYTEDSHLLAQLDWHEMLEEGATGQVSVSERQFFWLARYIGQRPLFYLVELKE
jgi:hypothetical protein